MLYIYTYTYTHAYLCMRSVQNATGYAARLLRRGDQCRAVCLTARLSWQVRKKCRHLLCLHMYERKGAHFLREGQDGKFLDQLELPL